MTAGHRRNLAWPTRYRLVFGLMQLPVFIDKARGGPPQVASAAIRREALRLSHALGPSPPGRFSRAGSAGGACRLAASALPTVSTSTLKASVPRTHPRIEDAHASSEWRACRQSIELIMVSASGAYFFPASSLAALKSAKADSPVAVFSSSTNTPDTVDVPC
jgi:hypothetical protein